MPALAQAPAGPKLLVVLTTFAKANVAEAETQVRQGLARLGWRVGDNLRLEFRYADNQPERLDALARELVGLQPTAALARTLRLPSGAHSQAHVQGGGLFGYGPDLTAMWQRAVQQADAVLRGQPVGGIAFEQPTRIILTLHRETASSIALAFTRELLLRADEVFG